MVNNNNRYKFDFIPAFSLKVFNDNYEKEFFICLNQLVSILYVDFKNGEVKVSRGRVCDFENKLGRTFSKSYTVEETVVVLDTSEKHKSSSERIRINSILEINPVDWRYPNIEQAVIPITFEDWYEMNKRVNAPSSAKEDRIEASNKRNFGRTL